jgi:hypothetical protein
LRQDEDAAVLDRGLGVAFVRRTRKLRKPGLSVRRWRTSRSSGRETKVVAVKPAVLRLNVTVAMPVARSSSRR